jgi:RecA-family ATPase
MSILLLGIILTFLYTTISENRMSNQNLAERERKINKEKKFVDLFHRDLIEAISVRHTLTKNRNSIIEIKTKNSLYDSPLVYVKWFLYEDFEKVIRAESVSNIKFPVKREELFKVRLDEVLNGIRVFRAYSKNKDKNKLLLHFQEANSTKPFVFEFYKLN